MDIDYQHFQMWYKRILENLYDDPHAGFPILMITFPLLERYLREKSENYEADNLDDRFHNELINIFPELENIPKSRKFWKIYRNGILHQSTLSEKDKIIRGCLTSKYNIIHIDNEGVIYINPAGFAKMVVKIIDRDFDNFIAANSINHMLPIVYNLQDGDAGTSGPGAPLGLINANETVSSINFQRFKRE